MYRKRNVALNLSFGRRCRWVMFSFAYFDEQGSDVTLPNQSAVKRHSMWMLISWRVWEPGELFFAPDRKWSETYPFSQIANDTGRTFSDGLPLKAEMSFAKRRIIFKKNLICITKTAPFNHLSCNFRVPNEISHFLSFALLSPLNLINYCRFLQGNTWIKINERLDEIGTKFL